MPIAIKSIDHVAMTAADLKAASAFYRRVLGAELVRDFEIGGEVIAQQFRIGSAMLNIHQAGHAHSQVAAMPTPRCIDLCFRWDGPIHTAIEHLARVLRKSSRVRGTLRVGATRVVRVFPRFRG